MRARLSRRTFLASSGAASVAALAGAALTLPGCGGGSGGGGSGATAFRLSTRGLSGASNAAKSHAANKRFVSSQAADLNRAHEGDFSKIVSISISQATWNAWFGGGADMVDLRST
ncbi:MAG: hypothetical protein AB7T63_00535 [Planctomycetota bacterium]